MSAPHDTPAHTTHPINTTTPADPPLKGDATAAHPPPQKPDPTLSSNDHGAAQGGQSTPHPSPAAELTRLKSTLKASLRQFKDFPEPGILFEDILPIFANPQLHEGLLRGLELSIEQQFGASGATREVAYVECFYGFQVIQRKSLRRMLLSLGLLTKRMWVTCLRRRISTMQVELTPA